MKHNIAFITGFLVDAYPALGYEVAKSPAAAAARLVHRRPSNTDRMARGPRPLDRADRGFQASLPEFSLRGMIAAVARASR
jgi:hypothetical protein